MTRVAQSLAPSCAIATSSLRFTPSSAFCITQVRHATLIPRPRRPYTFTQLVQLSDGSTYTIRTTSPAALYRAVKDTRNTLTWQPSEKSLRNVELDEAGKLAAFRERFGRGFDASRREEEDAEADVTDGGFGDLISEYANPEDRAAQGSRPKVGKQDK